MTVRSVSWADPHAVAALLSRAAPRGAPSLVAVRAMGAPPPRLTARPAPAPPRAVAAPADPPPLVHTSDNPADRLDALVAWTLDHYRCAGVFVADDNGLTLAAHGISEAHVSIVGPLLSALSGARTIPGVDATLGALWLGAQMMSWAEARTDRGGFCLGALGAEALPIRALTQLREALAATVRGF